MEEMTLALFMNSLQIAWRQGRRLVVLVIGLTVLTFGVALLVLPGPAFVVIPLGLGILSLEFAWARAWLRKLRSTAESAAARVREMGQTGSAKTEDNQQIAPPNSDRSLSVRLQ